MDNDNPLLQKAADLYRGLRFTMKYRGVDILPAQTLHGLNDRQAGKLRQHVFAGKQLGALFILG